MGPRQVATLTADIVRYSQRHNEANGEENRDGHSENYSSNWGVEGPSDDLAIEAVRNRVQHAMLATVFLAQGTPMLLAGDEFGRRQHGNNNAYCQDNETSWLDWRLADSGAGRALSGYVARLIALRHAHPVLCCAKFLHGAEEPAPGITDIAWFDEEGRSIGEQDWKNPMAHLLVLRRASKGVDGAVDVLTAFFNAAAEDRSFRLPPPSMPTTIVLDSAEPTASRRVVEGDSLVVRARSVVLTQSDVA